MSIPYCSRLRSKQHTEAREAALSPDLEGSIHPTHATNAPIPTLLIMKTHLVVCRERKGSQNGGQLIEVVNIEPTAGQL